MKIVRVQEDQFVFHLGRRERKLLGDVLQLYPLVPPAHHRIGDPERLPADAELQKLLDDALAEDRREKRRQVLALLNESGRFVEKERGFELNLSRPQLDWLLQVLNDIRVGSWLALGEPEAGSMPELSKDNARQVIALEVCGMFQSLLLAAVGIEQSSDWS